MNNYNVNGKEFNGYMEAVRYADSIKGNVVEIATGLI